MSEPAEVARLLIDLADDVPRARGLLHRAARLIVTRPPDTEDGCARCGKTLERKPRGRPRKWCSEACRRKLPEMV